MKMWKQGKQKVYIIKTKNSNEYKSVFSIYNPKVTTIDQSKIFSMNLKNKFKLFYHVCKNLNVCVIKQVMGNI